MSKKANSSKQRPICPKCGYDQSGEIATWVSSCPIEGMCTECAYEFRWANIVDPSRVDLLWYVEHVHRKRELVCRSPATLINLLIPNRFWREVGVSTRTRFRALLLWLLLIFLVLHSIAIVPVGMGNWSEQWGAMRGSGFDEFSKTGVVGYLCELHNAIFSPFVRIQYGNYGYGYRLGGYGYEHLHAPLTLSGFVLGLSTLWLIVIGVLGATRSSCSLRFAHLWRSWMITLIPVLFFFEFARVLTGIAHLGTRDSAITFLILSAFLALIGFTIIWVQWFWIAAMKIGWGIKPVWHISLLGSIASLLAGAIVFVTTML